MNEIQSLCNILQGTLVSERWRALLSLYADADANALRFSSVFNVHCPEGCGTCCEHFIPDLTEVEASLAAAYILFVKKDPMLLERIDLSLESSGACPLYNQASPEHCSIYPARALICRLFGSCPSEDKQGRLVFRGCRYNSLADSPSVLTDEILGSLDTPIHPMGLFGMKLTELSSGSATESLPKAILRAADQLRFIAAYLASDNGDDNGGSDPEIPTPVAS